MSDVHECDLPTSESALRKTWCEPALTEYDVEQVTASFAVFMEDGGVLVS